MPTDAERREIYDALERSLGQRPAALLMDALSLGDTLRGDMAELRGEMAEFRGEIRGELAGFRGELAGFRGELAEMRGELTGIRGDLRAQVPRLVMANVGLAFGTAGLVLAAARFA